MSLSVEPPHMYERILVPTDGSAGTTHVALQAIDLAEQYGATLYVLHVVNDNTRSLLSGGSDDLRERGQRAVDRVATLAESHDVDAITEIREGDPAGTVLDYAGEVGANIIVAGTHGRSGVERRVIGSVAERLVRHANCPVMTVRLPETDETVDDADHAAELAADALDEAGYDADVTETERQRNVWVVEASTGDRALVVYVDPVTQRTSVVSR
jgi:nucleotide-binding universal stress UspA family protein